MCPGSMWRVLGTNGCGFNAWPLPTCVRRAWCAGEGGARGLDMATRLPWCARGSTSVALTTICLKANSSSGLFVSRRPLGTLPAARSDNKQKNTMEENQAEWAYVLAPPVSHAAHPVLARRPLCRDPPTLLRLRVRDCHAMARLCGRRVKGLECP